MNAIQGVLGLLESKKANAFLLTSGAVMYLHHEGAHFACEICVTALGVAYIIGQSIVDAVTAWRAK